MVSLNLNLLVKNILNYTYLVIGWEKAVGEDIISDVVSNLASMRMMFLVWSSGQSN